MEQYRATIFAFRNVEIRVVVDEAGDPWFVAHDLRRALGHANPRRSISTVTDGGAERCYVEGLGLVDRVTIISEYEAYLVVADAKTARRDDLLRWLLEIVNPAIHRNKEYVDSVHCDPYDSILHWILANGDVTKRQFILGQDLYNDYFMWSRINNVCAKSTIDVKKYLKSLGAQFPSGIFIRGIGLSPEKNRINRSDFDKMDHKQQKRDIKIQVKAEKTKELMERKAARLKELISINAQLARVGASDARENVVKFPSLRSVRMD